jgi:hypothetical protein
MRVPDARKKAPRELVAAIIGAEAGTGFGLLLFGTTPLAPLGLAALGAAMLVRRWLRAQLRGAR